MRQRLVFHAPFRAEQRGTYWYIVVRLGTIDYSFFHGDEEPKFTQPMNDVILEYSTPEPLNVES